MKIRVELRVRLKVADLVAQTAWMTLTEKLDFSGKLRGLARYSYWAMDAAGESAERIIDEIDRAVRLDGAFTNQNKHCYSLRAPDGTAGNGLARGDLHPERDFPVMDRGGDPRTPVFACDLLIREKDGAREEGFVSRLNGRLDGVEVSAMKAGEVWRILCGAPDGESSKRLAEEMAVTRSRREGLLLNPHYQRYEFIGVTAVEIKKESKD
ncbi:MAG: hypothetical protein MUF59_02435 [Candidatus Krumholzibacteria bacterium]|nr:hypothetical protein [Candidatus Krumholzibacteria bacterium]